MPLVKVSSVASKSFVAVLALAVVPGLLAPAASAADARRSALPTVKPEPVPTGSELVGKLLAEQNGPSDPDVPLPQRGLSRTQGPDFSPLRRPQIFGRHEDGGGVLGLKIPILPTRGAF